MLKRFIARLLIITQVYGCFFHGLAHASIYDEMPKNYKVSIGSSSASEFSPQFKLFAVDLDSPQETLLEDLFLEGISSGRIATDIDEKAMTATAEGLVWDADGLRFMTTREGCLVVKGTSSNRDRQWVIQTAASVILDGVDADNFDITSPLVITTGTSDIRSFRLRGIDTNSQWLNQGKLTAKEAFLEKLWLANEGSLGLETTRAATAFGIINKGEFKGQALDVGRGLLHNEATADMAVAAVTVAGTLTNEGIFKTAALTSTASASINNSGSMTVDAWTGDLDDLLNHGTFSSDQVDLAVKAIRSANLLRLGVAPTSGELRVETFENRGVCSFGRIQVKTSLDNHGELSFRTITGSGLVTNTQILKSEQDSALLDVHSLENTGQIKTEGDLQITGQVVNKHTIKARDISLSGRLAQEGTIEARKLKVTPAAVLLTTAEQSMELADLDLQSVTPTTLSGEFKLKSLLAKAKLTLSGQVVQGEADSIDYLEAEALDVAPGGLLHTKALKVEKSVNVAGKLTAQVSSSIGGEITVAATGSLALEGFIGSAEVAKTIRNAGKTFIGFTPEVDLEFNGLTLVQVRSHHPLDEAGGFAVVGSQALDRTAYVRKTLKITEPPLEFNERFAKASSSYLKVEIEAEIDEQQKRIAALQALDIYPALTHKQYETEIFKKDMLPKVYAKFGKDDYQSYEKYTSDFPGNTIRDYFAKKGHSFDTWISSVISTYGIQFARLYGEAERSALIREIKERQSKLEELQRQKIELLADSAVRVGSVPMVATPEDSLEHQRFARDGLSHLQVEIDAQQRGIEAILALDIDPTLTQKQYETELFKKDMLPKVYAKFGKDDYQSYEKYTSDFPGNTIRDYFAKKGHSFDTWISSVISTYGIQFARLYGEAERSALIREIKERQQKLESLQQKLKHLLVSALGFQDIKAPWTIENSGQLTLHQHGQIAAGQFGKSTFKEAAPQTALPVSFTNTASGSLRLANGEFFNTNSTNADGGIVEFEAAQVWQDRFVNQGAQDLKGPYQIHARGTGAHAMGKTRSEFPLTLYTGETTDVLATLGSSPIQAPEVVIDKPGDLVISQKTELPFPLKIKLGGNFTALEMLKAHAIEIDANNVLGSLNLGRVISTQGLLRIITRGEFANPESFFFGKTGLEIFSPKIGHGNYRAKTPADGEAAPLVSTGARLKSQGPIKLDTTREPGSIAGPGTAGRGTIEINFGDISADGVIEVDTGIFTNRAGYVYTLLGGRVNATKMVVKRADPNSSGYYPACGGHHEYGPNGPSFYYHAGGQACRDYISSTTEQSAAGLFLSDRDLTLNVPTLEINGSTVAGSRNVVLNAKPVTTTLTTVAGFPGLTITARSTAPAHLHGGSSIKGAVLGTANITGRITSEGAIALGAADFLIHSVGMVDARGTPVRLLDVTAAISAAHASGHPLLTSSQVGGATVVDHVAPLDLVRRLGSLPLFSDAALPANVSLGVALPLVEEFSRQMLRGLVTGSLGVNESTLRMMCANAEEFAQQRHRRVMEEES